MSTISTLYRQLEWNGYKPLSEQANNYALGVFKIQSENSIGMQRFSPQRTLHL